MIDNSVASRSAIPSSRARDAPSARRRHVTVQRRLIAVIAVIAALWIAHATRFGRTIYAIGGSAKSAALMGLPNGGTLVGVYAVSGLRRPRRPRG